MRIAVRTLWICNIRLKHKFQAPFCRQILMFLQLIVGMPFADFFEVKYNITSYDRESAVYTFYYRPTLGRHLVRRISVIFFSPAFLFNGIYSYFFTFFTPILRAFEHRNTRSTKIYAQYLYIAALNKSNFIVRFEYIFVNKAYQNGKHKYEITATHGCASFSHVVQVYYIVSQI